MTYTTLIKHTDVIGHLGDPDWAVVDCRFSLQDTERGRRDYLASHIPGAVYAHLDEDLSGSVISGKTGRHPLPAVGEFAHTLSDWGIDARTQVVAYDDAGGMVAARLWWMLRWLGHDSVAVLDGGWPVWVKAGHPTASGAEQREARRFEPAHRADWVLTTEDVEAKLDRSDWCLIDSRTPERYRGEQEPIDPVAGHIPGAINAPNPDNLDGDGCFLSPQRLRARFEALLGDVPSEETVFYCGSGVSAARNLLAYAHAGLGDARLYAGSWSEWIADRSRPIATGPAT